MSTLSVKLPDSLHKKIKEIAKEDGFSINQFISSAAAEKVSAIMTVDFLKKEAKLVSKETISCFFCTVNCLLRDFMILVRPG